MAATIAIAQNDDLRILAYSTLSQLGYIVTIAGLRRPDPHDVSPDDTRVFSRPWLFLGAGSVILALHHEQDIWKMGGLWRKTPITFWTFLIGTLALAGVPPLSGFYSKDQILLLAFEKKHAVVHHGDRDGVPDGLLHGTRRCLWCSSDSRVTGHAYDHAHESPLVMTLLLVFPWRYPRLSPGWQCTDGVPDFLASAYRSTPFHIVGFDRPDRVSCRCLDFCWLRRFIGSQAEFERCARESRARQTSGRFVENKYYFDELHAWIVKYVQGTIATICELFDRWILQLLG